jgi:hypothetical protein
LKTFHCDRCGSLVFFENTQCLKCGGALGFLPDTMDVATLEQRNEQLWQPLAPAGTQTYRQCANATQYQVCNWLVPHDNPNPLCEACALNQLIPDLKVRGNQDRWHKLEVAKRRVLYTLKDLGIPPGPTAARKKGPVLTFSFLADAVTGPKVMTGHNNGVITINIAEADDAVREARRVSLNEAYRTLLGHMRHEVAHYYWLLLIKDSPHIGPYCKLFGDPSADYAAALKTYYQNGPRADWREGFISAYASAHPAEDWAETFAHYLHIHDMVETAAGFGLSLKPKHPAAPSMSTDLKRVELTRSTFDEVLAAWFPLTYALNEINRGMGLPDVYPFVLSAAAMEKLRFVHHVVQESQRR